MTYKLMTLDDVEGS